VKSIHGELEIDPTSLAPTTDTTRAARRGLVALDADKHDCLFNAQVQSRRVKRQLETPADRAARLTAVATIWMAAFTVVLAITGVLTYLILKNQLQEMRQVSIDSRASYRLDERAWMGVSAVTPMDFSKEKGFPLVINYVNSGKTPARNITIAAGYRTSEMPIAGPFPPDIARLVFTSAQSVAPQGRYNQLIGYPVAVVDHSGGSDIRGMQDIRDRFEQIKSKKLMLYYFGTLRYDDIFGSTHSTDFCIFLADPDLKDNLAYCQEFNDLN